MNLDEFAFVNQQLAAMLRDGIPLEGALRQLCATMARGKLRDELTALEADLARGVPLEEALAARKLPELYVKMLQVGVKSGDLPGVLTMLGDYYWQVNSIWTRLKGLMVYPVIVLVAALGVSVLTTLVFGWLLEDVRNDLLGGGQVSPWVHVGLCGPTVLIALLVVLVAGVVSVRSWRARMRWRLSPFREANLSQVAWAMAMLLKGGCTLGEAIGLVRELEAGSPAGRELARWAEGVSQGVTRFRELALAGHVFPRLFGWLVDGSGENLARGFERAAEFYRARAAHRVEMFLYATLPLAAILLGLVILIQVGACFKPLADIISMLGEG